MCVKMWKRAPGKALFNTNGVAAPSWRRRGVRGGGGGGGDSGGDARLDAGRFDDSGSAALVPVVEWQHMKDSATASGELPLTPVLVRNSPMQEWWASSAGRVWDVASVAELAETTDAGDYNVTMLSQDTPPLDIHDRFTFLNHNADRYANYGFRDDGEARGRTMPAKLCHCAMPCAQCGHSRQTLRLCGQRCTTRPHPLTTLSQRWHGH